jgi:hypothetical protein
LNSLERNKSTWFVDQSTKVLTICATLVDALVRAVVDKEKSNIAIAATTSVALDLRVANASHAVPMDALATQITSVVAAETATSCGTADAALIALSLIFTSQQIHKTINLLNGQTSFAIVSPLRSSQELWMESVKP